MEKFAFTSDVTTFPDVEAIKDMITKVSHFSIAFGLDVGVLSTGEIAIEMNDFCCLHDECFGLVPSFFREAHAKKKSEKFG